MICLTNLFFNKISKEMDLCLDTNQRQAASHLNGPALVLAVPGAGKTTVLITRIAYLRLVKKVPASEILSITFSKASAIDMENRFDNTFGKFNINAKFSTIHSFSYLVLRDYFIANNLNYNLIERSRNISHNSILREIYKNSSSGYLSDDKLEELISSISYVKNMMISPGEYKCPSIPNFEELFYLYEEYKKNNKLIDFDDMLTMALDVLNSEQEILNRYRNRYKYIQIDEGQDTSTVQHKIIEKLAHPNNNLFIVADDDQSIYGFRGANPQYLLDYKDKYKDAKIYHMDRNYRSSKTIVDISNEFISQNKDRYEKNLHSNNGNKTEIITKIFNTQEQQYEHILKNLSDDLSENAVLFRYNISLIPLIDIMDRKGLRFRAKDLKFNFFNHWITSDIVAFFNLIVNASDKNAFERIYYKMNAFISKKAMNFVLNSSSSDSVFNILADYDEMKTFQKKNIRNLGIKFKRLAKSRPIEIINYIENDLEYMHHLQSRAEFQGQSLGSILIYFSTIKILASRTDSILDFLFRLENLKDLVKQNSNDDGVFLSTIHSAKGLEFENVFIIDLVNGEFPSSSSLDADRNGDYRHLEEERRVFYVGMTRAKENLQLLTYKERSDNLVPPSDFFNYIRTAVNPKKSSESSPEKGHLNSKPILSEKNTTYFDKAFFEKTMNIITNKEYSSNKEYNPNEAYEFSIGDFIHHKKFGNGKVVDLDKSFIMIDFNKKGVKSFSKDLLIEKKLIFKVK